MSHYQISPKEFKIFVEDYGFISALAAMASMAEHFDEMDPTDKCYILDEARRLIKAVERAAEVTHLV